MYHALCQLAATTQNGANQHAAYGRAYQNASFLAAIFRRFAIMISQFACVRECRAGGAAGVCRGSKCRLQPSTCYDIFSIYEMPAMSIRVQEPGHRRWRARLTPHHNTRSTGSYASRAPCRPRRPAIQTATPGARTVTINRDTINPGIYNSRQNISLAIRAKRGTMKTGQSLSHRPKNSRRHPGPLLSKNVTPTKTGHAGHAGQGI